MLSITSEYGDEIGVCTFEVVKEEDGPVIKITRSFSNEKDPLGSEAWTIDTGFIFHRDFSEGKVVTNVGMKFTGMYKMVWGVWGVQMIGKSTEPYWLWHVSDEDIAKLHQLEDELFAAQVKALLPHE